MSRFSHYSGGQSIGMEPIQHPGSPPPMGEKPIDFSAGDFRGVVVKSGSEDYNDHDYYQEDYVEENEEEGNGLRRQLKGRHISVRMQCMHAGEVADRPAPVYRWYHRYRSFPWYVSSPRYLCRIRWPNFAVRLQFRRHSVDPSRASDVAA